MQEEWRILTGIDSRVDGRYWISNKGRVLHINRKKEVKPFIIKTTGYWKVNLSFPGKGKGCGLKRGLHRLVALCFVPIPESDVKLEVDHKNRDKTINSASNLQWVSHAVNCRRKTRREQDSIEI